MNTPPKRQWKKYIRPIVLDDYQAREANIDRVRACFVLPEGSRGAFMFGFAVVSIGITYFVHILWFELRSLPVPVYKWAGGIAAIPPVFFLISPILGILAGELYYRFRFDRLYFARGENEIIRGYYFPSEIPFNDIVRIVDGIPYYLKDDQKIPSPEEEDDDDDMESPYIISQPGSRYRTLLFILADETWLPVNFSKLLMGKEFQEGLLKRLAPLLDRNFEYTREEQLYFIKKRVIRNGKPMKKIEINK